MAKKKIGCCNNSGGSCPSGSCPSGMTEPLGGCSTTPTKPLGCTSDLGAKLKPAGFVGDHIVGLRYQASPQCGKVPGDSFGMSRAQWIAWTKKQGHRVDPVEALRGRLEDAGRYEYALTEPTGE